MSAPSAEASAGTPAPIDGPRLRLRPLQRADLPSLRRWRSDPEVERFWGRAPADDGALWEESSPSGCGVTVAYVIEEGGRGLGLICYSHSGDGSEEVAAAGIDLYLGAPGSRDRGVGTEALRTLLGHLFEVERIHRVTIDPEVDNSRAIRSYEKAGFRFEGVLRHNDRIDGRWVDAHLMSILQHEWPEARARWQAEAAPPAG